MQVTYVECMGFMIFHFGTSCAVSGCLLHCVMAFALAIIFQIAIQMALIISKIARFDYPHHWKSLIPHILQQIASVKPESSHPLNFNIMLIFKFLVKELSSKQLPGDKKLFCEVCCDCFNPTFSLLHSFHSTFCNLLKAGGVGQTNVLLQNEIILLKAFRCMRNGFDPTTKQAFLEAVFSNTKKLLHILFSEQLSENILPAFHKLLIIMSKILRDVSESDDCLHYAQQLLGLSLQCIYAYAKNQDSFKERFVVNCMIQIKFVTNHPRFQQMQMVSLEDVQELLR